MQQIKRLRLLVHPCCESHMFSVDDSSGSDVKANDDLMWVCFKIQLLLKLSVD